jgi:hypothetical protein
LKLFLSTGKQTGGALKIALFAPGEGVEVSDDSEHDRA